jgi:hypothetical protein
VNKDSMNTGVQILLERMDTNPEEFEYEVNCYGWGQVVRHARATHTRNVRKTSARENTTVSD